MKRIGRYTVEFETAPSVVASAASVGKTEGEGPLSRDFDHINPDDGVGCDSWEHAEVALIKQAALRCMEKAKISKEEVDVVFAGDLLNQCTATSFGFRELGIPILGLYGACSTFAAALYMAALTVDCGAARMAMAEASSHFCAAEKQFRYPLEYGGQRTPTSQRTVTGSGAALIGQKEGCARILRGTVGIITDYGITDMTDMGAAMAPAAARTIAEFLKDTHTAPSDYEMILTGDLGFVGSELLLRLLREEYGVDIASNHADCGKMIFDREKQDAHAGGSGCGCSAAVVCSRIINAIATGKMNNVLFAGTGALMSPLSAYQGDSIPAIAHAVLLS